MNPPLRISSSGFSLTELMIGLVLTSILMTSAYRFISTQTNSAGRSLENAQRDAQVEPFFRRLDDQLRNAIPLTMTASGGRHTKLRIEKGIGETVSGLIPIPSVELTSLNVPNSAFDNLDDVIQTFADITDFGSAASGVGSIWWTRPNDAFRLVSFSDDADVVNVAPKGGGSTYSGFESLLLEDANDVSKFEEGDFFRICTNLGCDVGRVTAIDSISGRIHRDSSSVWNESFDGPVSYGSNPTSNSGPTFIQKVEIRTYAFYPEKRILYVDDHLQDNAARVLDWKPVLANVSGLRVLTRYKSFSDALKDCRAEDAADELSSACYKAIYEDDCSEIKWNAIETRFYLSSENSDSSACEPNPIGYPGLLRIVLEIDLLKRIDHVKKETNPLEYDLSKKGRMAAFETVTYRREFNPIAARSPAPGQGNSDPGDPLYVKGDPVPPATSTPVAPSGPPGASGGGF